MAFRYAYFDHDHELQFCLHKEGPDMFYLSSNCYLGKQKSCQYVCALLFRLEKNPSYFAQTVVIQYGLQAHMTIFSRLSQNFKLLLCTYPNEPPALAISPVRPFGHALHVFGIHGQWAWPAWDCLVWTCMA